MTGIRTSIKTRISDTHELKQKAKSIAKNVVEISVKNQAGHIAPSLSCIDLLTALYYKIMQINNDPKWADRDRLIFSKAHGCYGLYSILADIGHLPKDAWTQFYKGGPLSGCLEKNLDFGIEASCGSLGHGLPMAVGIAYGAKLQNKNFQTYCIVGDGELQEGSNWEALQFATKYQLTNLTVIVDANGLQAMDYLCDVLTPEDYIHDIENKLKAFGLKTYVIDGHNMEDIINAFSTPHCLKAIIAKTIKGHGLKCMENIPKFHFRLPTEEELKMGGDAV